jgi:hypothetical protein
MSPSALAKACHRQQDPLLVNIFRILMPGSMNQELARVQNATAVSLRSFASSSVCGVAKKALS